MLPRLHLAARLILPSVWIGLIIAIDLIEAPLKFQAPGITIPLGLGIGRLVFTAMNIAEVVIAVLLLVAVLRRPRPGRAGLITGGIIAALLVVKTAIIRPLLAVHTDAVLAGTSEGGSMTHIWYIGVDAVLFIALIVFVVQQIRGMRFEIIGSTAPDAVGTTARRPAGDADVGGSN